MRETDDIYIRILKWADEKESFTYTELREEFEIEPDSINDKKLRAQISIGKFLHLEAAFLRTWGIGEINRRLEHESNRDMLSISVEDKFRLIEYTELQEARKSSRIATWFASAALIVSLFGTVAPIVLKFL